MLGQLLLAVQPALNGSKTPLTDFIVQVGLVGGSGAVLGGIAGFLYATIAQPKPITFAALGIEVEIGGLPKPDIGTAIAVTGPIGSIAILTLRVAEYYGLV